MTLLAHHSKTFQDIDGYGNGWLWETDDETETIDELGHVAPVVEAEAANEPGHEAPAAAEPIQSDSIASAHSTRPSREIRIIYTRRKRKPETDPVLSLRLKRRRRMSRLPLRFVIEYDIRNQLHFWISDLESEKAEMKKKLDTESQKVEVAEAGLVASQQKMVTMGENVEAAVALATTCLMMFSTMIRADAIA
ncbi:hypothetical protein L1987_27700 [Smallanthus sonchifolius]|uniref:Uncharacterized protein n=1 Tax=Smallanthus sonchifolius TaxID=185202 RepID=A0ACB9IBC1_9ASTR|nr:hypothetical protein L1987_27700 [Smallanthus sonchifolius]